VKITDYSVEMTKSLYADTKEYWIINYISYR